MVDATPASTWRDLTRVSLWWDPAHTWSGSARNLKLEPKAGGCFCEKLPTAVRYSTGGYLPSPENAPLQAALGPLQAWR